MKFKGGAPAADSLLSLSQAGPGTAGRAGIRGRTQRFARSQAGHQGIKMPPTVRWSAWSTGWLWIFGAALGQCLGYGSEQQRVAFLQHPGQNHLQASYMELRPSQVMLLLHFVLGWEMCPAWWHLELGLLRSRLVGWGKGRWPPSCCEWQGLLQCLTDCSPEH